MKTPILVAAALLGLANSAGAQTPKPTGMSTPAPGPSPAAGPGPDKTVRDGELSADMAETLRKAGFTDVEVLPNSVFVRAKDKGGNPVAMVLNPNSMTEVVTLDPHTGTAAGGNGAPLTGSGTFVSVLSTERLASALIGIAVVGPDGKTIGAIKDMAIDHGGVHAYIVGVGGILGIGDRCVAVAPGALSLSVDKATGIYHATMNATVDQLKAAPEFKFEDLKNTHD